jgi:3-isopropylmalate/(R)-2-methylmalate dehydratase large subunit
MPARVFDKVVVIDAADIAPSVTWGTSPEDVLPITGRRPRRRQAIADALKHGALRARSLDYMGLEPGQPLTSVEIENGVHRLAAPTAASRTCAPPPPCSRGARRPRTSPGRIVVPGSGLVKKQAEEEGLDKVFIEAGLEWREPGCSACLGMNPDKVPAGERCASTSNRNFVGRQGPGARTHLVSPAMAAAAAVTGRLTDVRELV